MIIHYQVKIFIFSLFIMCTTIFGVSNGQLRVGFYLGTCPITESIVHRIVQTEISRDPQQAPRLLRLFFHDCLVEGCDGSILLDSDSAEKHATANLGLGGFDVIDEAKKQLEAACPGVVSCADVVALAARDAVVLTGGPSYEVPTGRRDGRISESSLATRNMPEVDDSIELLKSKFRSKGLSDEELVLLSAGGHTIGTTACFFMTKRLYNFTGRGDSDPGINPELLPQLKTKCPRGGDVNVRLPLDWSSETTFDDQILRNIRNGFAVASSDARLNDDANTTQVLDTYVASKTGPSFKADFARAMVNLGNVGVKTDSKGEIRRVCNAIN
ncbi:hypothetical protein K2173_022973 [Erythroxylum novogranatense]|uniref:Peroxidase n=1 Tax=Erythroxylum novogranatense TaxID=1862640 RepID=A0AAV8T948_9ROSI|nr:hypothetical protein K2173_022973 [Erythroxylum novogranatense]